MTELFGVSVPIPEINLTGFLSSSWVYVFIVVILGMIATFSLALILFFYTFNRKVELYENVAGRGFQRISVRRARVIKLGTGGTEILKLIGGGYITAYGSKIGLRRYMFVKGQDGYWYNCIHGDLDAKKGILDIEPVNKDVRMFHVAKDRMNKETYGKRSFLEKYGIHILLFAFLIVLILGMWFIIGKIGDATQSLSTTAETNARVSEQTSETLSALANLQNPTGSGLVPATEGG
jgi:hypothetical protein